MFTLHRYVDENNTEIITEWLKSLTDRQARARIETRFLRLQAGNFGDCKALKEGVAELRIDYGPGYRVYYGRVGKSVILLLCGGDKRKQQSDIERATILLKEFKRRSL